MALIRPIIETLYMADGTPVQTARYEPSEKPICAIQMIHGFGEHIGRYDELGKAFARRGFAFIVYDQRGHGARGHLTERERKKDNGVAKDYSCFLDDIDEVYNAILIWYPGSDVLLMGHSMGGNIAANYLLRRSQERFKLAILETPWLRLFNPKAGYLLALARGLGKISPNFAITDKLNLDMVTRDTGKLLELKHDYTVRKIFHTRLSFRLYAQITDAGEYAIAEARNLRLPILLLCANDDRIVSPAAIRDFKSHSGANVEFKEYEHGYHALHNDIVREAELEDIVRFIEARLPIDRTS